MINPFLTRQTKQNFETLLETTPKSGSHQRMLNAYRKQNFPGNPTSLKTPLNRANSNHSPCRNFLSSTLNLHLHFNHETCPAQ